MSRHRRQDKARTRIRILTETYAAQVAMAAMTAVLMAAAFAVSSTVGAL